MNRKDLIECLAREMADTREDVTWERVSPNRQFLYRGDAASMLPGVVAFVANWIEHDGVKYDDSTGWVPQARMKRWREDMGA